MSFGLSQCFRALSRPTAAACFTGLLALSSTSEALVCSGRIPNPITDVCWSCMEPITIAGSASISGKGKLPDAKTDAAPVCSCGSGVNRSVGINISFWEPLRTAEVVRHSWCFPSLGGMKLDPGGIRSSDHGRTPQGFGKNRRTAFWQTHWYQTPWLFVLAALLDNACIEEAPWDLAYLSELDPLWDDSMSSFLLSPDSALFTAGAAFGACAVDCALANAGLSEKTLYWCSGCQGSVFPLSGWMAAQTSPLQAWQLMAHRFAMKLSREGLLWSAHGKKGQCGPYLQPIFDKSVWRTQLLYPSRTTDKSSGGCCQPLGRSTSLWGSGKTFPYTGEDGAVLLWRKRDCCLSAGMADAAAKSAEFMSNTAEGIAARRSALSTPDARLNAPAR